MKFFKEKKVLEQVENRYVEKEKPKKLTTNDQYAVLQTEYEKNPTEKIRLEMVKLSELSSKQNKPKKKFSWRKKKDKLPEVYCPNCKHSIQKHHKKQISTGCRDCGCLFTLEKIQHKPSNHEVTEK